MTGELRTLILRVVIQNSTPQLIIDNLACSVHVHQQMKAYRRCDIYNNEYYSAVKNDILEWFVGKCMHLETFILRKINKTHDPKYYIFLLNEKPKL